MRNQFMKTAPARGYRHEMFMSGNTPSVVVVSIPHISLLLHVINCLYTKKEKKKKKRKEGLNTGQTTDKIHERCAVGVLSHV